MCSGVSTGRDMAASSILAARALDWPSARLSSRLTGVLSGRRATGGALLSHSRCHSPLLCRTETTLRTLQWDMPTRLAPLLTASVRHVQRKCPAKKSGGLLRSTHPTRAEMSRLQLPLCLVIRWQRRSRVRKGGTYDDEG